MKLLIGLRGNLLGLGLAEQFRQRPEFSSVGENYVDFGEVTEQVVVSILSRSRSQSCDDDVVVECDDARLAGHLTVPLEVVAPTSRGRAFPQCANRCF